MTEVGETASRVESLIQEANDFEKLCNCDLDTASAVIEDGKQINNTRVHNCFLNYTYTSTELAIKTKVRSFVSHSTLEAIIRF